MTLYAIREVSTDKYIFNARGGAYRDHELVVKKAKKLSKKNPGSWYEIVEFEEVVPEKKGLQNT